MLAFQPKYRLGHPENYLFSLSKKYIFWIEVSKKHFIKFEKGSTDWRACNDAVLGSIITTAASGLVIAYGVKREQTLMMEQFKAEVKASEASGAAATGAAGAGAAAASIPASRSRTRIKQSVPEEASQTKF